MLSAWLPIFGADISSAHTPRTAGRRESSGKLIGAPAVRTDFLVEGKTAGGASGGGAARLLFVAVAVLAFVALASTASAGRKHLESWYADALAEQLPGSRTEVRMQNGTRCDVLARHHAVEVEFAAKWCEAIGQALNYASQTGRRGTVALILEADSDKRFLVRMKHVIAWHQLPVEVIVLRPVGAQGLEVTLPAGFGKRTDRTHHADRTEPDFKQPVAAMDWIPRVRGTLSFELSIRTAQR